MIEPPSEFLGTLLANKVRNMQVLSQSVDAYTLRLCLCWTLPPPVALPRPMSLILKFWVSCLSTGPLFLTTTIPARESSSTPSPLPPPMLRHEEVPASSVPPPADDSAAYKQDVLMVDDVYTAGKVKIVSWKRVQIPPYCRRRNIW